MLNDKVRKGLAFTMWSTCYFGFCPYEWDSENFRFIREGTRHKILHRCVFLLEFIQSVFTISRFATLINTDIEPRPFIMSAIYVLGRTMEMLNYYQFHTKKHEVMNFANAIFQYMDDYNKELSKKNDEEKRKQNFWDYTTLTISVSSFLVIINPPVHALLIIETPCVPNFISSIILKCDHPMDHSQPFLSKVPLIILENFLVMSNVTLLTYNWTLIFLGSAWIKYELKSLREALNEKCNFEELESILKKFRKTQVIVRAMNESFKVYLAWSPSIISAAVVLLTFSTIRYAEVDVTSYLMFPACAARCIFESYSLLAWAGHVNELSKTVKADWNHFYSAKKYNTEYLTKYHKSCQILTISAGHMYTLESTIVLTTLNNCTDSTFSLLIMYP